MRTGRGLAKTGMKDPVSGGGPSVDDKLNPFVQTDLPSRTAIAYNCFITQRLGREALTNIHLSQSHRMPFKEKAIVRHKLRPEWGAGRVLVRTEEYLQIDFTAGGLKK